MTLCERTEHDVRLCLNTLQFLSKRTRAIRSSHVSGVQCAQKDMVKSAFGIWQELFTDKVRNPHHLDYFSLANVIPELASILKHCLYALAACPCHKWY